MQRILAFLRARGSAGATSREITEHCGTYAPSTDVSALRHNGYAVECDRDKTLDPARRIWRYRLIEEAQRRLFALILMILPLSLFA
jgi:hypothetical protein